MAETAKVATKHPAYTATVTGFVLMRDSIKGEPAIKAAKTTYLTTPAAMDKSTNKTTRYAHYLEGADYVELIAPIIDGIQGLIHQKEPDVLLPNSMEYLRDKITPDGKDLVSLFQDMTREIISVGRIGLLPEVFTGTKEPVYLCQYTAESIINWRKTYATSGMGVSLLVLEERNFEASDTDEFAHEEEITYRVLRLNNDDTKNADGYPVPIGYSVQAYVDTDGKGTVTAEEPVQPERIGRKWEAIPFVCVNAINLEYDIGPLPLLPAARRILAAYQKSASYNRALYLCADPTVVRTGIEPKEATAADTVGGGNCWNFENPQAKVEFLELDGNSIPFQRDAIQDDFKLAEQATGRLFDNGNSDSKQKESADAIRLRQSSQQATTKTIVISAAQGLEKALKNIAIILGENPDNVKVIPNLDFAEVGMTPADLVQFMAAKTSGAPITAETIHNNMVKGGMTNKTFEEETSGLESEGGGLAGDMVTRTAPKKDPVEDSDEDDKDPKADEDE